MENLKQIYKELDFLDEKSNNINLEMVTLEKEKNEMEEKKATLTKEISELEEEKKNILLKTDNRRGIIKYLYMILQASADLKNIKIIDAKLEENRTNLQSVENKLDIKNKLIKEKLEEKLNVWKRREELYNSTTHVKETEKENIKESNQKDISSDFSSLMTLYTLANQVDFKEEKTSKIKDNLIQNLKTDIEKYIKENNIKMPKNIKTKNKKKEEENEC